MVSPTQRRVGVSWAQDAYRVSERRAIRALGVSRSSVRYRSQRAPRAPLRARIREIAESRVSYGYRQVHTLLRREGWRVNHKLVYRLYREEGLVLRRKRPKRRRSAATREGFEATTRANERWAMDFVHDTLSDGRTLRILTVVDVHTRECVALRAGRAFRGADVVASL
jgi:putative transposase